MSAGFTYRVLRYMHDPAAGETLNIGVILFSPATAYLGVTVDTHYERLSNAFSGFNGENFRQVLRRLETAVNRFRQTRLNVLPLVRPPESVDEITRQIWPDEDLTFRMGPTLAGVTEAPEDELYDIFERLVSSQYLRDDKQRRTDDDVWNVYKRPLAEKALTPVLRPKGISTRDLQITFEYAFQNDNWHVLQPISLDVARTESMQRKAAQWLGYCTELKDSKELSQVYLLLGEPQLQAHRASYQKAKNILNKIPLKHEIVEERDAEKFAENLRKYMRQHAIIRGDNGGSTQ
jgi:hypothetical protein